MCAGWRRWSHYCMRVMSACCPVHCPFLCWRSVVLRFPSRAPAGPRGKLWKAEAFQQALGPDERVGDHKWRAEGTHAGAPPLAALHAASRAAVPLPAALAAAGPIALVPSQAGALSFNTRAAWIHRCTCATL